MRGNTGTETSTIQKRPKSKRERTQYPGIYKLGESRYQIRVRSSKNPLTNKSKEVVEHFRGTLKEALGRQSEMRLEVRNTTPVLSGWTMNQLMDEYFSQVTKSPSTLRNDRNRWGVMKPGLGDRRVRSITSYDLDLYFTALLKERGIKPQTVNRYRSVLSPAFSTALRWGVISNNPMANTSALTPVPFETEQVAYKRIEFVLENYKKTRNPLTGDFLQLALLNQSRRGEICGLQVQDYDATNGILHFQRGVVEDAGQLITKWLKNRRSRKVKLDPLSREIVERLITGVALRAGDDPFAMRRVSPEAFLFSDVPDSSVPWRPDRVTLSQRRIRQRTCPECGWLGSTKDAHCSQCLDNPELGAYFRVHDLRGWMTTTLLDAGVSSKTVQSRGGWEDETVMRKHYHKRTEEGAQHAIDIITELFSKGA